MYVTLKQQQTTLITIITIITISRDIGIVAPRPAPVVTMLSLSLSGPGPISPRRGASLFALVVRCVAALMPPQPQKKTTCNS